jgi:hypothetical protein
LRLVYYPGTCLEGLRETTKNFSQDSRYQSKDLNPGCTEYEAGVPTTQPARFGTSSWDLAYFILYY